MLNWRLRSDNVICAEPSGLRYWYYIEDNVLQLVDNYGNVSASYNGTSEELKIIAQQHCDYIVTQLK